MVLIPIGLFWLFIPNVAASLIQLPPILDAAISSLLFESPSFVLEDEIVGRDFLTHFMWQTSDDPTHGRVNYLDQTTSLGRNLTRATSDTFIMHADDTNIVPKTARGRDSNRIASYKTYLDSVTVLDVKHVPWGCATWPAFWTVTQENWPNGGEIDILEGVNQQSVNRATLHTSEGCQMDQNRDQTGTTVSTDCVASHNGNEGCGTDFHSGSYGPDLNAMGGGWFVMKRTQSDGVYVWFYGRNDVSVPPEIKDGKSKITPNHTWKAPDARFPSTTKCDFATHFDAHAIVFDLTFCGDWAGNVFLPSCGPKTCEDFVNNSPQDFQDAYWEINSLRVYTPTPL